VREREEEREREREGALLDVTRLALQVGIRALFTSSRRRDNIYGGNQNTSDGHSDCRGSLSVCHTKWEPFDYAAWSRSTSHIALPESCFSGTGACSSRSFHRGLLPPMLHRDATSSGALRGLLCARAQDLAAIGSSFPPLWLRLPVVRHR